MIKRIVIFIAVSCALFAVKAPLSLGFTLLTQEQALGEVFPRDFEIEVETKELSGETLTRIEKRLGGSLVFFQEGSKSERVSGKTTVDFYFGKKAGKRIGVAVVDIQPGKWGPVQFIIAMTVKGQIKKVRVMAYQEIRGRPIAQNSFMNQYKGKNSKSTLQVGRDIIGISGATISSRAATFTVKKALVVYEEVYLKTK